MKHVRLVLAGAFVISAVPAHAQISSFVSQERVVLASYAGVMGLPGEDAMVSSQGFGPFVETATVGIGYASQNSTISTTEITFGASLLLVRDPSIFGAVALSRMDVRFNVPSGQFAMLDITTFDAPVDGTVRLSRPGFTFETTQLGSLVLPLAAGQYRYEVIASTASAPVELRYAVRLRVVPGPSSARSAVLR